MAGDGFAYEFATRGLVMIDARTNGVSNHETIMFKVKPNPLLYALEASRFHLLVMLAMVAVLIPILHFLPVLYAKKGLPISIITQVTLILYGIFGSVLFLFEILAGRCLTFIIVDQRAVARLRFMGKASDKISIPLASIETIEIRSCNGRHGNVFLKGREAAPKEFSRHEPEFLSIGSSAVSPGEAPSRPPRTAHVITSSGWASVWRSAPSSSPVGFYGFRHFDAFATLIVELQAAAQIQSRS